MVDKELIRELDEDRPFLLGDQSNLDLSVRNKIRRIYDYGSLAYPLVVWFLLQASLGHNFPSMGKTTGNQRFFRCSINGVADFLSSVLDQAGISTKLKRQPC